MRGLGDGDAAEPRKMDAAEQPNSDGSDSSRSRRMDVVAGPAREDNPPAGYAPAGTPQGDAAAGRGERGDEACEPADAAAMVVTAAGLSLPHEISTAASMRTEAIVATLLAQGVPAEVTGIARTIVPEPAPEKLREAYATGQVMKKDQHPTPSFADRLSRGVGTVDPEKGTVEFEGFRFTKTGDGRGSVTVSSLDGTNARTLDDPGDTPHDFTDHTAATVRVRKSDGTADLMVIDPAYDKAAPLSLSDWRDRQNNPNAVVLTGGLTDPLGTPYQVHRELMPEDQRARFDALPPSGPANSPDLGEFFSIQHPGYGSEHVGPVTPENQHRRRSELLASEILSGNDWAIKADPSGARAGDIVKELAAVTAYQRWLKVTGGVPGSPGT